ncbi:MAG TPA: protease pro-enzyme activation domain-containing protein [Candidatus Acidoferrum sp.]|nr:protease pro-enzyme activation domain-containing protein [Candidatus Acidoferrum sp.]
MRITKLGYKTIPLMVGPLLALWCGGAGAQTRPTRVRITEAVDEANLVQLRGNVHPLARAEFDQGVVADSQPMNRILLLLQRSPEQQAALSNLMEEQLTKSFPNYHKWLTPEEFGKQFGPADADIQAVTAWLGSHGFQGIKVGKGRTVIEFSGNVGQVRNAFHTEIHQLMVKGEEHAGNVSDPQIPAALTPVVAGVVSLHNFRKRPHLHPLGTFRRTRATGELKPLFTTPSGCGANGTAQCFAVGPPDFAKIYNVPATINGNPAGQGQTIAIVGRTNINLQDVADFRNLFGLPVNLPNIILNGPDPGNVGGGEETEADLDVEWSGAVAPNATIDFVVTETPLTNGSDGVDLSALYIVDNNLAGVMSESFGSCEFAQGTAGNRFQNALWEQAAAQGISVMVAAGDNGSAGCDGGTETAATQGLAISGTASTPFNVAVGGTDFDDVGNTATFWNTTNSNPGQESAKGYIPETTWNDSCAVNGLTSCTTVNSNGNDIVAGSGGPSNCLNPSGPTVSTCTGAYGKPAYQKLNIIGIPQDGVRDIPDVSLFSSNGNHGSAYIVCQADTNPAGQTGSCNLNSPFQDFILVGGTSGPSPSFAGIMALVNQKVSSPTNPAPRQGNANAVLYQLAAAENFSICNSSSRTNPSMPSPSTCVFNDISTQATKSTISVACKGGTPNCSNKSTAANSFGILTTTTGGMTPAFNAGVGYDLATGLGSVDVTNLTNAWATVPSGGFKASATALQVTSNGSSTPPFPPIPHGQQITVSVTVSHGSGGTGTPTGVASLLTDSNPDSSNLPGTTATTQLGLASFTLNTSGVGSGTINNLPGGTYTVSAHYAGDGTFGPSDSTPPISVMVTPEGSQTTIALVAFAANGAQSVQTSVPYGSPYILKVGVTNGSGTQCFPSNGSVVPTPLPCPTGKVTLTDNNAALNDFNGTGSANLNNQGILEDQPVQLLPGSHALVATYAGDSSFSGSTSATDTVQITQAATTTTVKASPTTITSGGTVTLTATVSTQSSGVAPGGALTTPVQFLNGTTPISGTITLNAVNGPASSASLTATLTTTLSALGIPDTTSPWKPKLPPGLFWLLGCCALLYGLFLVKTPQASRRRFAYAGLVVLALAAAGIAGCGGGSGSSTPPVAKNKTVTVTAKFVGDSNYTASSGTTTVTVQ